MSAEWDRKIERLRRDIGAVMRAARSDQGYDQRSVEREIGRSKGSVSKLETASADWVPSLDLTDKIEAALDIEPGKLRRLVIAINMLIRFQGEPGVTVDELRAAVEHLRR